MGFIAYSLRQLVIPSLLFVSGCFLFGGTVRAENVIRTGDVVAVTSDQSVEADLYGAGERVVVSGTVAGDALLLGGRVTLDGTVGQDVFALGASVDIKGSVQDDVRLIAGDVTVSEHITGDLVVIARSLTILSTATIDGDIIFFGGEAEIAGAVGKGVIGRAESLRIDGSVAGNIEISVGTLTLGDRASVIGDVTYTSSVAVVRAPSAVVEGELVRSDPVVLSATDGTSYRPQLILFLLTLFALLSSFLLFRRQLEVVVSSAVRMLPRTGLVGISFLLLVPVMATVLLFSVLGVILGALVLLAYTFVLIVSLLAMSVVVGTLLQRLIFKAQTLSLFTILGGAIVVAGVSLVPVVGPILIFFFFIITLGAVVEGLYAVTRGT